MNNTMMNHRADQENAMSKGPERVVSIVPMIPPLPKRKRVAAYARVSVDKDAMLHSLAAQISYYKGLIQGRPEWEYAGVYADEGLTGTKENRPEFQRLLTDCRAGKIDMVIVKSISRLARNTVTMLATVRELKGLGIDILFEKENIHSMSGDGELMLSILASLRRRKACPSVKTASGAYGRTSRRAKETASICTGTRYAAACMRLFRKKPRPSGRYTNGISVVWELGESPLS